MPTPHPKEARVKDVPVWSMDLTEEVLPSGDFEVREEVGGETLRGRGKSYYDAVAALRKRRFAAKR